MAFVVLALFRLLSERSLFTLKEKKMKNNKHTKKAKPRKFINYVFETLWAVGAGVIGSPLGS